MVSPIDERTSLINANANVGISDVEQGHHHHHPIHFSIHERNNDNDAPTQKEDDLKSTLASVAGNILEWYDFAIYGYFSDIIGQKFFPSSDDESTVIIDAFLVFGGAFLVRPIGGIVMGYIGDRFSRKRALEISIFLMAVPTFAMGCLPTYEAVGWWAVVLLVFVRLLQGLSVGGQLMSSLVFVAEGHDHKRWGFYGVSSHCFTVFVHE